MTHPPSGVGTQLLTVELSLWSSLQLSPVPSSPSCWGMAGCRNARRELGPSQPSQMTAHTKKDLTLCHNCSLTRWPARKNSTRLPKLNPPPPLTTLNPDPPPHCIHPPSSPAPTFLLTPAACIKDPSEVSLATFTSERGPIMERLGRRMRRQRGTHRCGEGWEEGPASHCCHPPPIEGRKKGGLGRGEEVKQEVKVAFYT